MRPKITVPMDAGITTPTSNPSAVKNIIRLLKLKSEKIAAIQLKKFADGQQEPFTGVVPGTVLNAQADVESNASFKYGMLRSERSAFSGFRMKRNKSAMPDGQELKSKLEQMAQED